MAPRQAGPALGRADLHYFDLELAGGHTRDDRVSRRPTYEHPSDRRFRGQHVVGATLFFARADEIRLGRGISAVADRDDLTGLHNLAVVTPDDFCVIELLADLADPRLLHALLVTRRVVLGVLAQIAMRASACDLVDDL